VRGQALKRQAYPLLDNLLSKSYHQRPAGFDANHSRLQQSIRIDRANRRHGATKLNKEIAEKLQNLEMWACCFFSLCKSFFCLS